MSPQNRHLCYRLVKPHDHRLVFVEITCISQLDGQTDVAVPVTVQAHGTKPRSKCSSELHQAEVISF